MTREVAIDPVDEVIGRWRAQGETFVVVDISGRHRLSLARGRLDLSRRRPLEPLEIDVALNRIGYAALDASNLPRAARPGALRAAAMAVAELRRTSGRPAWVLVDGVQEVLAAIGDVPVRDGGVCLASRGGSSLPGWTLEAVPLAVRVTRDEVDLVLLPPTPTPAATAG